MRGDILERKKEIQQFLIIRFQKSARGNRKTLKRPKMMPKLNLKLKSHEEYLICRTYFVYSNRLDFQAKSQS